jgi:uncharacterized DUF497 family protein
VGDLLRELAGVVGFEWDEHNAGKIRERHGVQPIECEEVLLDAPRFARDTRHSSTEVRYVALGATRTGRRLTVVFTLRGPRVRVVSARPQSRRERREVGDAEKAETDTAVP